MGWLADLLLRAFRPYGGDIAPSRSIVELRELDVVDVPASLCTRITGLKRPTSSEMAGAIACATDTNSDGNPDDLRYSTDVCAVAGTGLEYRHGAAVVPTGDAVRARCEVTGGRSYFHVHSAEADGRVLTSPRFTEGEVATFEVTGGATTPDASTWTTVLTIPGVYAPANALTRSIHAQVWLSRGYDSTPPTGADLWIFTTETPELHVADATYHGLVYDTNIRVQASGNDLVVQVCGTEPSAPQSWKAFAEVRS